MPDRTALVTGGAGGLGRSVVDALVADGWAVLVPVEADSDLEPRDGVSTVVADLTDPDDVARAVRGASDLRALVNLVGGFAADQPVADTPIAEFERLFRLNLRPTYLVTQAALPRLISAGGGSIVCVGSSAALNPFAGGAGYAASKAAVIAFARAVAEEGRAGRRALQRDRADPDRHAREPRGDAGVRVAQARPAAADRVGHRVPVQRRVGARSPAT